MNKLLENAKPILFNTEMVKAILDGRKTQTRRVFSKYQNELFSVASKIGEINEKENWNESDFRYIKDFSKYQIGDILYVRETFVKGQVVENGQFKLDKNKNPIDKIWYKADNDLHSWLGDWDDEVNVPWKPSIHMPKELARIFLKVINVRVERLQDMETSDMLREGVSQFRDYIEFREKYSPHNPKDFIEAKNKIVDAWINLWNSTAKDGCKWEDNPYVFIYEFERIDM